MPTPANGLVPAHRGLTDRLVLQRTRVTAGTEIKGTLVVISSSQAPVNLTHGCRPDYVVVLTSRRFPPDVAFSSDCSGAPFIIRPGENRIAITVLTTFLSCVQIARLATPQRPACLPHHRGTPPLPAGRYEAVLVGEGLPLPAPAPVLVSLSAAPAS
jgi:hypothetical protein